MKDEDGHTHNGVLVGHKKENLDICDNNGINGIKDKYMMSHVESTIQNKNKNKQTQA